MKYESSILKRLVETYGVVGNPRYISEIIKEFLVRGKESFPNLFTYQSDWLAHIDEFGLTPEYTVSYTGQYIYAPNTKEKPVKRAILSGSTKYHDIDTGEFLETFEEGRNLELVSVKMPVLTTSNGFEIFKTGTTLDEFDYNLVELNNGCISIRHSHSAYIETKKEYTLLPNQSYVVRVVEVSNFNNSNYNIRLKIGDRQLMGVAESLLIEELSKNSYYDIVYTNTTGEPITGVIRVDSYFGGYKIDKIYIGEEPYKTNILTVNEPIELRGIGDVKDELNLLTGEVVERIGEIVLNEDITGYQDTNHSVNGYSAFRVTSITNIPNGLRNVICDKVKYYPNINLNWTKQEEFFTTNGNLLFVKILSTKASNFEELRTFLSSSPITIQYELAESVKTVDLTIHDKDHQKVERLTSFEGGTHFTTSSQDGSLPPTLAVDVVTDLEETLMVCSLEGNTM